MKQYFQKGTKLFSILNFKCPHCQEGDFFESNNPYNLSSASKTKEKCAICEKRYSIEPGFYYGAMYVSYGLSVAHIIAFWLTKVLLNLEVEFWNFIFIVGGCLVLLTPLYYALSKIIWANMFFSYQNNLADEKP